MRQTVKYMSLSLGIFSLSIMAFPQSADWEWVRTFGGKQTDGLYSSCADCSGNVYAAGYFQGEIDIDGVHLKSKGDTDAIILKMDPQGNLCWVKQVGGDYRENLIITEYAKKVKVDNSGDIIVAGIFAWNADADDYLLRGNGNNDIFIIKYSPNGDLIWAKSLGSFNHDFLFDMDVDRTGNIYVSGISNGSFFSENEGNGSNGAYEGSNTFLLKLDSKGEKSWIKKIHGAANKAFIAINNGNNIYFGINYSSDLISDNLTLKPLGASDFILEELNPSGEVVWQKKYSSKSDDILSSLSIARNDQLLISGKYANVSELKLKSSLDSIIDNNTYYSKMNADGSLSWSIRNSGPSYLDGTSIIELPSGVYYSTDVFTQELSVGKVILHPQENWFNSYLAQHDCSGNISNIIFSFPGIINGVIPTMDNNILIAGTYSSTISTFNNQHTSGGSLDFFIGKLKVQTYDQFISKDIYDQFENWFDIFPNPSTDGLFTIESKLFTSINEINITDSEGKFLTNFNNCELPFKMDLSKTSKGVYYISLIAGDKIVVKKIMIV